MSDIQQLDARFGDGGNRAVAVPPRPGQATQVEQARAIAEVRAAVMIAMDRPRDRTAAISEMREVCGIMKLAERAFFRVPRGGQQVNGETIQLARELARCWGNIDYGVKELARDDAKGQSELLAFAWDLQTNARSEITFIVPHLRGSKRLAGTQEIYENNASFAGRRLREAIFAVLPVWFKAEAAELCHKTLEDGGGKPLVQRIADLRTAFEALSVSPKQLEEKRGRKVDNFLPEDVAALRVIYGSLKRGEVTIAEEFPADEPEQRPTGSKLDALEGAAAASSHSPGAGAEPHESATPSAPGLRSGSAIGSVGSIPTTGTNHSPAGETSTTTPTTSTSKGNAAAGAGSEPEVVKLRPNPATATTPAGDDLLGDPLTPPGDGLSVFLPRHPVARDWRLFLDGIDALLDDGRNPEHIRHDNEWQIDALKRADPDAYEGLRHKLGMNR